MMLEMEAELLSATELTPERPKRLVITRIIIFWSFWIFKNGLT